MTNKDLEEFAKYFSHGVESGLNNYQKGQANQIAAARARILAQDKAANDRYRTSMLGIRQQEANDKGVGIRALAAKRAGAGAAVGPSAADLQMQKIARDAGVTITPPTTPPIINVQGADPSTAALTSMVGGGSGGGDAPPTLSGGDDAGMARGGVVKKFAGGGFAGMSGGIDGTMSLDEAARGGPGGGHKSSGGSGAAGGLGGIKIPSNIFNSNPYGGGSTRNLPGYGNVTAVGTQGSNPGGAYTTSDLQPGGSLYAGSIADNLSQAARRGGMIRKFARGGRVTQAIDTGTSGPGSGFGVPAAPPVVQRRARNGH